MGLVGTKGKLVSVGSFPCFCSFRLAGAERGGAGMRRMFGRAAHRDSSPRQASCGFHLPTDLSKGNHSGVSIGKSENHRIS